MSFTPARTLRRLAAASTAVLLLGSLAACGSDEAEATGKSGKPILRVGVQKDGVRSVLTAAGALEDLPYEIEWSEFTAGMPIVEAAAADEIDVAWVGSAPPIFGAASNAPIKVVAAVVEEDAFQDSVLVPGDSDIKTIEDLEGKEVAVMKGSSAHGLLLNTLADAGMSIDDITASYLAPPDALAAFQTGEVDAWSTWDPFVTQAVAQDGAVDLTELTGTQSADPYLQFEIASEKSLEEEDTKENITHFIGVLNDAFQWAKDNPDAWAEGWSEESGLPVETTSAVVAKKRVDIVPVGQEHIDSEQKLADAFAESGEIPAKIDFADIVESLL